MRCVVVGGTGTVGSRVCAQLHAQGDEAWPASRSSARQLRWEDASTWPSALAGAQTMYLLLPDHAFLPDGFLDVAAAAGIERVVAHSDRSVQVMRVEPLLALEEAVKDSGIAWTIVRPGWFHQDLETFFRQPLLDGLLQVPVGDAPQSWVDADDIAAVAAAALGSSRWEGQTLVVSGPQAVSMPDAVQAIAAATGRSIAFDGSREGYLASLRSQGVDDDAAATIVENFERLVDAGDFAPTSTVREVTGREPRSLHDYIAHQATLGTWGGQGLDG